MITHKTFRYYIGIDPGVITGIAIWDSPNKKFLYISSGKILDVMDMVEKAIISKNVFIKCEDPRLAVYGRGKKDYNIAQGAGSIKRDAQIWEDFLKKHNADFIMLRPAKAFNKWKADKFQTLTKWDGVTNGHGRDAAMVVFGS